MSALSNCANLVCLDVERKTVPASHLALTRFETLPGPISRHSRALALLFPPIFRNFRFGTLYAAQSLGRPLRSGGGSARAKKSCPSYDERNSKSGDGQATGPPLGQPADPLEPARRAPAAPLTPNPPSQSGTPTALFLHPKRGRAPPQKVPKSAEKCRSCPKFGKP